MNDSLLQVFKMHKNITNDSIKPSNPLITIPVNKPGFKFLRLEEVQSSIQGIPRAVYDFRIYIGKDHHFFNCIDKPIITDDELEKHIDENTYSDLYYNRYRCFTPYSKYVEKSSTIEITCIGKVILDTHLQSHFIFFYVTILECDLYNGENGIEYSLTKHTDRFLSQLAKNKDIGNIS